MKLSLFDDSVQSIGHLFLGEFIHLHPNITVNIYWATHARPVIRFKSFSPNKAFSREHFHYSYFTEEETEI